MTDKKKTTKKPKTKPKKNAKAKAKAKKPEEEIKEPGKSMAGRPKTLLEDLPDDWQSVMLQLYEQGATDVEIRATIKVHGRCMSNDLWYRLIKEEKDFSETVHEGKILSEAWWIGKGRRGIDLGKDFGHQTWAFCIKNMFPKDFQDKKVIEGTQIIEKKIILEVGEGQKKVHDVLGDRATEKGN